MQTRRGSRHHLLKVSIMQNLDGNYLITSQHVWEIADSPSRLNANGISNVVGGQEYPQAGGRLFLFLRFVEQLLAYFHGKVGSQVVHQSVPKLRVGVTQHDQFITRYDQ